MQHIDAAIGRTACCIITISIRLHCRVLLRQLTLLFIQDCTTSQFYVNAMHLIVGVVRINNCYQHMFIVQHQHTNYIIALITLKFTQLFLHS